MQFIQSIDDERKCKTVIPLNRVREVIYNERDNKYFISIYHDDDKTSPLTLIKDNKQEADRTYITILDLIGQFN